MLRFPHHPPRHTPDAHTDAHTATDAHTDAHTYSTQDARRTRHRQTQTQGHPPGADGRRQAPGADGRRRRQTLGRRGIRAGCPSERRKSSA